MTDVTRREAALLLAMGLAGTHANAAVGLVPARVKPKLDHIVWAVPDLEEGRQRFAELTGVMPMLGGQAPGQTRSHNALARLGDQLYIEVFAPRVQMKPGRWLDLVQDGKSHVASYGMRVDGFSSVETAIAQAELNAAPYQNLSRTRPDGVRLSFNILQMSGSKMDDCLPFFIDWLGSRPHPSEDAPEGVLLEKLQINHPDAAELQRIFKILGIDLAVAHSDKAALAVRLATKKGSVLLES